VVYTGKFLKICLKKAAIFIEGLSWSIISAAATLAYWFKWKQHELLWLLCEQHELLWLLCEQHELLWLLCEQHELL